MTHLLIEGFKNARAHKTPNMGKCVIVRHAAWSAAHRLPDAGRHDGGGVRVHILADQDPEAVQRRRKAASVLNFFGEGDPRRGRAAPPGRRLCRPWPNRRAVALTPEKWLAFTPICL